MKIAGFYAGKGGKITLRPWLAFLLAALAFVAGLLVSRAMTPEIKTDANITYIGDIPVYQDYLPLSAAGRTGVKREIKYLVIHETDNFSAGADASAHNAFIHQNGETEELSWHYTVDDHQIYHHLPDDESAYHAGDHMENNGGNKNGIGIEMCVNADGDYEKTLDNTVQLCAHLLQAYDLKPKALRMHRDFSGKECPAKLLADGRWDEFCERVSDAYTALQQTDSVAAS